MPELQVSQSPNSRVSGQIMQVSERASEDRRKERRGERIGWDDEVPDGCVRAGGGGGMGSGEQGRRK